MSCGRVRSLLSDSYWVASCDLHHWRAHPTASRERATNDLQAHRLDHPQNPDAIRALANAAAAVSADRQRTAATLSEQDRNGCGEVIDLLSGVYWLASCTTHRWHANATSIRERAVLDLEWHREKACNPGAPGQDSKPS